MRAAGIPLILALPLAAATASAQLLEPAEQRDPAYWVGRMEQAQLPQSSLRASFVLDDTGPIPERHARLVRVQGPRAIRSVVTVVSPEIEREVLRIRSEAGGRVERMRFVDIGEPIRLAGRGTDAFLDTQLSYEDLGFVPLRDRAKGGRVGFEDTAEGRVIRIESGPYGPYGKVVTRLDPETALPREVEYYDEQGVLTRRVRYSRIDTAGSYRFPLEIDAVDLRSGRRSSVRFEEVEIGAPISEAEFDEAQLERERRDLFETDVRGPRLIQ